MTRDWKNESQWQPTSLSKIELLRVTYDPAFAVVAGRVEWSDGAGQPDEILDIEVLFDGRPAGVRTRVIDPPQDSTGRTFSVTTDPVPIEARGVGVRVGQSAVLATLA